MKKSYELKPNEHACFFTFTTTPYEDFEMYMRR